MKIRIVRNEYLNAFLILILFSAILHIAVLFCQCIYCLDPYILNYFNILDFDFFAPHFAASGAGFIFSWVIFAGLYLIFLGNNMTDDNNFSKFIGAIKGRLKKLINFRGRNL